MGRTLSDGCSNGKEITLKWGMSEWGYTLTVTVTVTWGIKKKLVREYYNNNNILINYNNINIFFFLTKH
jgi:hypothetical protein